MNRKHLVALLAAALAVPLAPALAGAVPPAGMTTTGSNAVLPQARTSLGARIDVLTGADR